MEIRAFRGWRFAGDGGDLTGLVAPPYDVLSAEQKQRLLAGCQRNIVAVDLPHVPPKEAGPDSVYAAAARQLAQWQADGTLVQDAAPAVYGYDQTYTWAGRTHTRRALLAGVRATPLGADQDVIPHEHTFAGPKADRLKLTQHTRMQLSPIFGFYQDPQGRVASLLAGQTERRPDACGVLEDVKQQLWVIDDLDAVTQLAAALRTTPAFIADGHHRYTTAMNYRDELLAAGRIDDQHEANFVLFALVDGDDPGLLVLPTHRLVSGLSAAFSLDALIAAADAFEFQQVDAAAADLRDADAFLKPFGPTAMGFLAGEKMWIAMLKDPTAMVAAAGDHCEPWRKLDVAILQTLIMDGALAEWKTDETFVDFTPDGEIARQAVADGKAQLALLLQSTPVSAVQEVALAGDVMPHKSTYFYPKLATGMVLKPLQ
ncbi:hypothetical protein LCGC14_0451430 [marine sediment metagenome]|uniref:DUF1015 domain-containing protein n=1 Tax=marine sediment metagenome TaxID=412755 RepID=A0A0F9SHL9_9ZZZZ|nr:DUF1015 domain-containing protein [Phycisphaerae bacterium]HDZ44143.1 DUF1015 domain-containing protein [Phycisphaerae bacterium]